MDLQIIDKRIDTRPLADRLTQGESNADECMIVSERFYGAIDLAALTWEIRGTVRDRNLSMSQVLTPEDSEDQLRLPWKIGPEFLTTSGTLRLTLVGSGANGDVIVKFNGDKLYINPNDLSGFAPSTSPIEKMWAQMVAALETAKECAQQTASDAEAAKVSEKSAASSAAAALASEQSSATSKQAAESAAKEAKEAAQEAVGFRTMQGSAVLPIDGDIDLTQPYPTKTGESLTVTSAENRIDSVTINGFTTQTGSGDSNPSNIMKIENAGAKLYKLVIDGSQTITKEQSSDGHIYFRVNGTWPEQFGGQTDESFRHQFCSRCKIGNAANTFDADYAWVYSSYAARFAFYKTRPDITDEESMSAELRKNPLIIWYLPKNEEDADGLYTPITVAGARYGSECVGLKDRLHNGDKLDTNIQSEFDAELLANGSEDWKESSTAGTYCLLMGALGGIVSDVIPQSSYLPSIEVNSLYAGAVGVSSIENNTLRLRLPENADPKTYLPTHPLRIFYKSASGGAPKNIKREEHARKTYVFTGTENIQKSGLSNNSYYIDFIGIAQKNDAGTVICNQAKAISGSEASSYTGWGVCSDAGRANTLRITSPETTLEGVKSKIAEAYASENPFIIEYELATPEVYADTPVIIDNPQGTYTVSGESGTTCQAQMKRLQDGGDATTLNGHSWDDIVSLISEMVNSKGE